MTTTSLTTELEAVNTMLQAADEAPVSSLSLTGLYPLELAKTILSETSRTVQSMGWDFNTEESYPLALAGDSTATLPANVLSFNVDPSFTDMDIVQRGLKLYDKRAHSYVLKRAVTGTAVVLLAWDDMPQAARHYITIRAAKTMQGRSSVSETTYRYTDQDVLDAKLALSEHETEVGDHNMLRDSWSVASVLFDRDMR